MEFGTDMERNALRSCQINFIIWKSDTMQNIHQHVFDNNSTASKFSLAVVEMNIWAFEIWKHLQQFYLERQFRTCF